MSSLAASPSPSLSISTASLESGSTHSDVSLPSVSSTPPPPVPSRAKPPAATPLDGGGVASAEPPQEQAAAKKSPAPPPPSQHQEGEGQAADHEWPVAPPSVAESPPGTPPRSPTPGQPLSPSIGAELIELVRKNTALSYELSRVAVGVVVGHLQVALPQVSSALEQVLVSLVESKVRVVEVDLVVHLCLFLRSSR